MRVRETSFAAVMLQIVFNRYCNSQDIVELLAQAAGVNRCA